MFPCSQISRSLGFLGPGNLVAKVPWCQVGRADKIIGEPRCSIEIGGKASLVPWQPGHQVERGTLASALPRFLNDPGLAVSLLPRTMRDRGFCGALPARLAGSHVNPCQLGPWHPVLGDVSIPKAPGFLRNLGTMFREEASLQCCQGSSRHQGSRKTMELGPSETRGTQGPWLQY